MDRLRFECTAEEQQILAQLVDIQVPTFEDALREYASRK